MEDEIYQDMLAKRLTSLDWSTENAQSKPPYVPVSVAHSQVYLPDFLYWVEWVFCSQN